MFRYYLLGGETAAPSGLHARFCHAFLVPSDSLQGVAAGAKSDINDCLVLWIF